MPSKLKGTNYPTKQYANIERIDSCAYKLTYDESKAPLTKTNKAINLAGGVLVELIKIEDKCFYYKSTIKDNNQILRIDGKMCKE